MIEDYRDALKLGQKQLKKAQRLEINPYPDVLQEILDAEKSKGIQKGGERAVGTFEIPVSLITGTREAGRQNAFSREFYPLLEEHTEFAMKWVNLFESQMEEGLRDAIKVYEYKNRFYVQEGNKRVSVSRYLKMPMILASVTRIMPEKNETPESKRYYEAIRFFDLTHLYQIQFSEYGSYEKLLKMIGKTWESSWEEDEVKRLGTIFYYFSSAFRDQNPDTTPEKVGDGFLAFLGIFPYEEIRNQSSAEILQDYRSMKKELKADTKEQEVVRVMEPDDIKGSLVRKILASTPKQIRVAFLYDETVENSDWTYAHELGRQHVQDVFGDALITTAYENVKKDQNTVNVLEEVAKDGNTVIFTTSPNMMPASVKTALVNPGAHIFNCSVNFPYKTVRTYYPRMYEAKFLTGLIAGIMSDSSVIGYEAGYPIYGTVSEINAFALGVQMVRPNAMVKLYWSCLKDGADTAALAEEERADKKTVVSAKETMTAKGADRNYGLYKNDNGTIIRYATAVTNWGKFYEHILSRIIDGTMKSMLSKDAKTMNFWWGISSDVVDLVCSDKIPAGPRKLVEKFKKLIAMNEFHPFEGEILDQMGKVHGEAGKILSNEEIITMNWLCGNIIGSIPSKESLSEKAATLADVQGVPEE